MMSTRKPLRSPSKSACVLRLAVLLLASMMSMASLTGCLVAGYSSSGGAFIWPGGLGLVVVILVVLFLLRRRR